MEKVITEFKVIETDDGFRIEIKGDKEKIRSFIPWFGGRGCCSEGHGHGHGHAGRRGRHGRMGFNPMMWMNMPPWWDGEEYEENDEEQTVEDD